MRRTQGSGELAARALGVVLALCWLSGAGGAQEPRTAAEPGEDASSERSPAGAVDPEDLEAERVLEARFRQLEGLSGIDVSVRAGVATLGGRVLGFQDAERAVEVAGKTEGIVAVQDRIGIETGVEERVRPALDRSLERLRDIASYLPLLLIGLAVVAVSFLLGKLLGGWRGLFRRVSPNPFLQDLLRQIVQATTVLVGVLIALELLDATALVGAVLGAAGVFGLAVGFAFRDLVENYISSVLLSIRQPFAPNDHVEIDEHEGKVVRLTSRATILMTLDGNHLRLPNSLVFKGVILNYTRNPKRRFHFDVGVGVEEDLLEAQRLGIEQLREQSGILDDPAPDAMITQLGDSNVVIRFFGWVDQSESSFLKVRAEAIRRVKITLEDAGMDLPEPIYRVVLRRRSEEPGPPSRERPAAAMEEVPPGELAAGEAVDAQIAEERAKDEGPEDLLDSEAPRE